jgi:hypothetical protein
MPENHWYHVSRPYDGLSRPYDGLGRFVGWESLSNLSLVLTPFGLRTFGPPQLIGEGVKTAGFTTMSPKSLGREKQFLIFRVK